MSHRHGGNHYHHYRSRYGSDVSLGTILIALGIIFALIFAMTVYYFNVWNGGYHKKCGQPYMYQVCEECGYIEDIYCQPCGYHLAIPEWYKLEETEVIR